jgi:hypothetical protein
MYFFGIVKTVINDAIDEYPSVRMVVELEQFVVHKHNISLVEAFALLIGGLNAFVMDCHLSHLISDEADECPSIIVCVKSVRNVVDLYGIPSSDAC